ncbi:Hint domain-containing protein [Nioella nitratireducens]|uniref:Hint domain-containing protein n=1 Tax=Nioella nitratireducens TaxID=1287720 RepID=UPI0008FD8CEF|nr:Hint domain-containing protein [Nioella nitratireducens]
MFGRARFSESKRHLCEAGGHPDGCAVCSAFGLLDETEVMTPTGWVSAGQVMPGEEVMTYSDGFLPVLRVTRRPSFSSRVTCPGHFWPLMVAPGLLGNDRTFRLLPDDAVLFDTDDAEDVPVMIPARAMIGCAGVVPCDPAQRQPVTELWFARPHLVAVAGGAYVLCSQGTGQTSAVVDVPTLGLAEARKRLHAARQ